MKKLILLITCLTISPILAHKWIITNSTSMPITVRLKVALPLIMGSEAYYSEIDIHPGSFRSVNTGKKCVKEIMAKASYVAVAQALWRPKALFHCPGGAIDVTNVNGLNITVN